MLKQKVFNMKILLLSFLLSACAVNSSLTSSEAPIEFDIDKVSYGASHNFRIHGSQIINKEGYNFIELSFLKKHFLLETYLHTMQDDLKPNKDGKYVGKVSMTRIAYKVMKTSKNEFIVKIVEYESLKRSYIGRERRLESWNVKDMGPWLKNDLSLSSVEKNSTYKFTLLNNAELLEGKVLFSEMMYDKFQKVFLRRETTL